MKKLFLSVALFTAVLELQALEDQTVSDEQTPQLIFDLLKALDKESRDKNAPENFVSFFALAALQGACNGNDSVTVMDRKIANKLTALADPLKEGKLKPYPTTCDALAKMMLHPLIYTHPF